MSISSTTNRVSYTGNSSTTVFSFPYNFFSNSDLVVISRNTSTGVETVKTLTTHYTVTGAGVDGGGSVTMLTAPATGTTLIIYRDTAATQSMTAETDFFDTSSVEDALDRAAQATQRLVSRVDRAVRLTEGHPAGFDPKLPELLVPNAVLAVNAGGTAFEWGPDQDELLDAAAAAAASEAAAAASASAASTSAGTASTQASNAANSASAASTSATNASNSASAASTSATNASNSASAASTSASNASTSETNASNSASTASTQATNASNSASAASTSATNASNSASAASTSATNASNSASAASTSATNASNSAIAAAASAASAAAAVDDTAYDATSWNGDTTHSASKNAIRDKIDAMDTTIAGLVSDTAYDATSWNGVTTVAPSKNAVRDQIEAAATAAAALVSDTAYNATTWDGVTTIAPSKNAVRDQIEAAATAAAALVSDTAYNATTWDSVTTIAPSKNAVRDQVETMNTAIDAKVSDTAYDATSWNGVTTIAPSKNAVRDKIESYASDTVAFTNKDYDGGTASNTSRITVPKDTLANITALTRKEGTLLYATDTDKFYSDDGTSLTAVGSGSGVTNYIANGDAESATTGWVARNWQQTVTITIASPGVCTVTSTTGFYVGMPISFKTSGALPTGLTASTTYYVSAVSSSTTFKVAATLGGVDINTSGSQSGTHTSFPLVPINNTTVANSGLTFSRSTSSPLSGVAHFSLVQTNSTIVAGQGIAYPFTINACDKANVLAVSFYYNASSTFVASSGATGSDSDIEVGIWDVTNSVLIPISPKVITANGTNNFYWYGTFQTDSVSTSYALVLYTPTMNANATGWTFLFDNVYVGPQNMAQGAPVTDWTSYTLTIGAVTSAPTPGTSTSSAKWRRVGDSMEIVYYYAQTGAGSAGTGKYLFPLPSGYSIDTNKLTVSTATIGTSGHVVGNGKIYSSTSANSASANVCDVVAYNTTNLALYGQVNTAGQEDYVGQGGSFGLNLTTVGYSFNAKVPISGWSSNVQMSNDTSSSVVAMSATSTSSASAGAGTPVVYGTTVYDTNGGLSGGNKYTAPVSGVYRVTGSFYIAAGAQAQVYKNGVKYAEGVSVGASSGPTSVSCDLYLNAGDYVDIRPNSTGTCANTATNALWNVNRISGPTTIAVTDTVAARYTSTAGQSITNGSTPIVVDFGTKDYDTTGSVTTGASWKFTCPVSGKYLVIARSIFATATFTQGNNNQCLIFKNASSYEGTSATVGFTGSQAGAIPTNSAVINCVAGDYIDIRMQHDESSARSLSTSAAQVNVAITRIGN